MAAISLFGNSGSDGDIATSENQNIRDRAMEIAKLGNGQAGVYAASLGAGMMMENLAGIAGMKTRTQEKKEGIETILKSYAGKDQNDPQTLFSIAQEMTNAGFPQLAQEFSERARLLSDTQADNTVASQNAASSAVKAVNSGVVKEGTTRLVGIGNNEMKMQEYKNGKYVDVLNPKTGLAYTQSQFKKDKPSSFEEKKAYIDALKGQIDPSTELPYTEKTLDLMKNALLDSGGINVTFGSKDSFDDTIGTLLATSMKKDVEQAIKGPAQIDKLNTVLNTLNNGKPNVGFLSSMQQGFDRAWAAFGNKESMIAAEDTQFLSALLGSDVFPYIQSLGIGARGLDTPAEREFLQQVMTGTVKMEGAALEQLTRLRQKYTVRAIQEHNRRLTEEDENGNTYYKRYEDSTGFKLKVLSIPKMVRPKDRPYDVDDGQGGTISEVFPRQINVLEEVKDANGNVTMENSGKFVYRYRPNGPIYDEAGIDISDQYPDKEVGYATKVEE